MGNEAVGIFLYKLCEIGAVCKRLFNIVDKLLFLFLLLVGQIRVFVFFELCLVAVLILLGLLNAVALFVLCYIEPSIVLI